MNLVFQVCGVEGDFRECFRLKPDALHGCFDLCSDSVHSFTNESEGCSECSDTSKCVLLDASHVLAQPRTVAVKE